MKTKEAADISAARAAPANGVVDGAVPPARVPPKLLSCSQAQLFSHGPELGLSFQAAMTSLHFTDPAKRDSDMVNSNDRVHKSFFYGSKHIDFQVPKIDPNARVELMSSKKDVWAGQAAQPLPIRTDMYTTTNKAMGY